MKLELQNKTIIELIASYMVATGCNETTEANYCFYIDELQDIFKLDKEYFIKYQDEILGTLDKYSAVAECSLEIDDNTQYFYITFYENYCDCIIDEEE